MSSFCLFVKEGVEDGGTITCALVAMNFDSLLPALREECTFAIPPWAVVVNRLLFERVMAVVPGLAVINATV